MTPETKTLADDGAGKLAKAAKTVSFEADGNHTFTTDPAGMAKFKMAKAAAFDDPKTTNAAKQAWVKATAQMQGIDPAKITGK